MNQQNDNTNTEKTQALMKSGKAAKFLGVHRNTVQFWVKAGKLTPDVVTKKGYNLFSKETLVQFKKSIMQFAEKVHNETVQKGDTSGQSAQNGTKAGNASDAQQKSGQLVKVEPNLIYVDEEAEKLIQSAAFVSPVTLYSPKDKVSNKTWDNTIKCDEDTPVVTVYKSEDFGCIVRLNYDKIFADEHVITGANFSSFDRTLYDAVVTLMVAGNNIFSNTALWRVITQNPDAKLNDSN